MTKDQFTHEGNNSEPPARKTQNITSLVTAFTLLGGAGILGLTEKLLFGFAETLVREDSVIPAR